MRNRPDSRGRLAGLTPPGSSWPPPDDGLPSDDDLEPDDGWSPEDLEFDDGWSADAGWPRQSARFERDQPRDSGGWVPDVGVPRVPARRAAPVTDVFLPPRGRAAVGERRQRQPERPPAGGRRPPPDDPVGSPAAIDPEPTSDPGHRAARVRYRPHHAWGRVAQRWVPEPLREARIDPGRRGALLLTVVAAVAALVAAVGVWRDQPQARPVQAVSLAQVSDATSTTTTGTATSTGRTSPLRAATSAGSPASTSGGSDTAAGHAAGTADVAATTGAEVLVVSVTGAVRHPGLVQLPPGSRVADAIAKAGGVSGAADLTGINLAARLTDGASVVVSDQAAGGGSSVSGLGSDSANGGTARPGGATSTVSSGRPAGKVDLNTADAAALDALPGVGPVTAAAIVAWREKNGRYTSVEQLQEIQGIGPAKYAALVPMVTV